MFALFYMAAQVNVPVFLHYLNLLCLILICVVLGGAGYMMGSTPKTAHSRNSGSSLSGDETEMYGTLARRQQSFNNLRQPSKDSRGSLGGYRPEYVITSSSL